MQQRDKVTAKVINHAFIQSMTSCGILVKEICQRSISTVKVCCGYELGRISNVKEHFSLNRLYELCACEIHLDQSPACNTKAGSISAGTPYSLRQRVYVNRKSHHSPKKFGVLP